MVSFGMALCNVQNRTAGLTSITIFSIRCLNWLDWEDLTSEVMERKGFFSLDYNTPPSQKCKE